MVHAVHSKEILTIFVFYIVIIFCVGFVALFKTKDLSDYILGGRKLPAPIVGLGAGASDMSGWLLMALPGAIFVNGANYLWLPLGLSIGAFLNWLLVARRLRRFTEISNDSLTIPSYFDARFQDRKKILRMVTAVVVLVFFTFYASAGFVAGGILSESLFHTSYFTGLCISTAIIVGYTCIGGFLAISWIDFFQGSLMLVALVAVPVVTIFHIGGWQPFMHHLSANGHSYLNAFHGISAMGIFSLLAWGLGYFGQPHILVRFMAAKSPKVIPSAQVICVTWMILALYGAVFTGLSGNAFFHHLEKPESVFIELAMVVFNPWIAGFLIAAVLSAIMSAVSAQLLASSSALTEDLYRIINPSHRLRYKQIVRIARLSLLLIAVIAFWLASRPDGTVLKLVSYAWAGLGASFGPLVLLSIYWKNMTRDSALIGMLVGAITVIVWEILDKHFGGFFHLYSMIPGFFLNVVAVLLVGKYQGNRTIPEIAEKLF
ncbi:MAG: sodium/proline symporter PutP [Pseudomonadota bacterium]